MSIGSVSLTAQSGGVVTGSAADRARTLAIAAVCTSGIPGTLYRPGDASSAVAQLGLGPAVEESAAIIANEGTPPYVYVVEPTVAGAVSASTTHVGSGLATVVGSVAPHTPITITCTTGGTLGTAYFTFGVNGVTTAPQHSTVSYVYRPVGTFCSIAFGAATYVEGETYVLNVDGTTTASGSWVGTITPTSSPIDWYEVLVTVLRAGATGAAVLTVSLDNGITTLPPIAVPTGTGGEAVVVLANTGIVLTCNTSGGNFVAGDTYAFLAAPPSYASSDLTTAITAIKTAMPSIAAVHAPVMPSSASNANSMASAMNTAMVAALADGFDWQGITECPHAAISGQSLGSIIVSTNAVRDTADTDTVVRAMAVGKDYKRCAMHVDMYRLPSAATPGAPHLLRPLGWVAAIRFATTDPGTNLPARKLGQLPITNDALGPISPTVPARIGRDERRQGGVLDEVYLNTACTDVGSGERAFFTITSGVTGWKNLTNDVAFVSAGSVRVLNTMMAKLRPALANYLDDDVATNADGTIAERPRQTISADLDGVCKRALGLQSGGDFDKPQASSVTAYVLPTSQLGQAPKRLDVAFSLQVRGEITKISGTVFFGGTASTLTATGA